MPNTSPLLKHLCASLGAATLLLACNNGGGGSTTDTDASSDGEVSVGEARVVINELAAAGVPFDWVELHNMGDADIDLGGYFITDSPDTQPTRAVLPANTIISAGGFLALDLDSAGFPGFAISGDEAFALIAPDGTTVIDSVDWLEGDSPDGASYGRIPDGDGIFKTLFAPTKGASNVDNTGGANCGNNQLEEPAETCDDGNTTPNDGCSPVCATETGWDCTGQPSLCVTTCGDNIPAGRELCDNANDTTCDNTTCTLITVSDTEIAINEIVARPFGQSDSDHIELHNYGATTIDLTGWTLTDNDTTANRYVFPLGSELGPGRYFELSRGTDFDFNLAGDGDEVRLYRGDVDPDNLVDAVRWLPTDAPEGGSYGRVPDGTGDFQTLSRYTPAATNTP